MKKVKSKNSYLEERKKVFLKSLTNIRKEIKDADEFTFEMNKGVFDFPDANGRYMQHCYNGKMDVSFHIYSEKNDESKKHLKNYLLPTRG